MPLSEWVYLKGGPSAVARLLDVKRSTVSQWCILKALPRDQVKLKIIKISKGEVTFESMVKPFAKARGWV